MRSINQIKSMLLFAVASVLLCSFLIQKDAPIASMLFKVEKKGHKTAYIFGTSHLIPQSKFRISEPLEHAFESSNLLLMEVDMDDPMMPIDMASGVAMKDGMTISKMVNEQDKHLIDSVLTETSGIGLALYDTWKPLLLTPLLSFGEDGEEMASYDMTLVTMAKEKSMEIEGLENIKSQIDLLDEIPYQDQVNDLLEVMKGSDALEESNELFELYAKQDVMGLYNFIADESTEQELDALVLTRNKSWIPVIE
ncbi:MAG: TraB/GumN family protein, partial [Flavobacteriales bacterium]